MGLKDWFDASAERIRQNGWEGVGDTLYDLYRESWRLAYPIPRGTNVYERDWDVLLILDACRVDLMRSVADEYDFIGSAENVERFGSVGSMSKEWMAKTFKKKYADEVSETAYITANVFSEEMLNADDFLLLDEVWKYAWDTDAGTVPPRPVTDRIVKTAREKNPERIIAHYVQPHHPFLSLDRFDDAAPFGPDADDTVVDALRKGKIDRDDYWVAYRENLHAVLDDVELLLSNLDAEKVVITSDHGDALGEWGVYDHPVGCLHPVVRTVPWVETSAEDTGEHEPSDVRDGDETTVEDRLRSLGYV
ncbi:MAG: hypothetical protein U5J64_06350 [Halobacteriales archaeon]|nr:hypothetical protein [Halobacteriales archaeon]